MGPRWESILGGGFMNQNIQNIRNVLQQFANEEIGNRLSNFALVALKVAIEGELQQVEKKLTELEKPVSPPDPIKE